MGRRKNLTDEQIRDIYLSSEPVRNLAEEYEISIAMAYRIRNRHAHPEVTKSLVRTCKRQKRRSLLSKEEVLTIFFSQDDEKVIAKRFKVGPLTIRRIKNKESYPHYTEDLKVGQKLPNPYRKRLSKVTLHGKHDDAIPLNPEIRDLAFSARW